jgi:hypothetical protein
MRKQAVGIERKSEDHRPRLVDATAVYATVAIPLISTSPLTR